MIIKFCDPNTNCVRLHEFSDVVMNKNENDEEYYKYYLSLITGGISIAMVHINVPTFSAAVEYMDKLYNEGKLDLSCDANVMIEVHTPEAMSDEEMAEFLSALGALDDEDLDADDDDYYNGTALI